MSQLIEDDVTLPSGVRLAVRAAEGARRPFLLVHGLASNARLWDAAAVHLADAGHQVVAVDQRGHGRSAEPPDGYDTDTCAADLATLCETLGLTGDRAPVVAGQSWGGNVVLELGWRFPELVSAVVCVDGGTIEVGDRFASWEACKEAMSPPRLAGTPAADMEAMMRRFHPDWPETGLAGSMANFEIRPDGTVAPWLTFDRHLQILRALWEHRPSTRYPEMRVPVLLVPADSGPRAGSAGWSAAKREAVAAAEAAIPVVRTHWIPGDHDLHAQHPVEVAELLAEAVADGFFR